MGYSTDFDGHLEIRPPLDDMKIGVLNAFCAARHGNNTKPYDGCPGFWCNWEFSNDDPAFTSMYWNGQEKSYDMLEWARILFRDHFSDRSITGIMHAQGEEVGDVWSIVGMGRWIAREEGHVDEGSSVKEAKEFNKDEYRQGLTYEALMLEMIDVWKGVIEDTLDSHISFEDVLQGEFDHGEDGPRGMFCEIYLLRKRVKELEDKLKNLGGGR